MKKSIFLVLITGIIIPVYLFGQTPGDVNVDGLVDIVDALLTAQEYVGLNPVALTNPENADVNCDSTIDIVDALLIAQYYVGLISDFPCSPDTPAPTVIPTAEPTTVPTAVPTPEPTPDPQATDHPWGLKVRYRCGESAASTNQVKPVVDIVNIGRTIVVLEEITIRYYYTNEGSASEEFSVDYASIGNDVVTGIFGSGYVEVGFTAGAGNLPGGGSTGEIQLRINKSDWSNYNQSDDYSFDPAITSFTDYDRITLYQAGVFIWGSEPGNITPPPTPDPTPTPVPTATPDPVVYYIDSQTGNDSNDGHSSSSPLAHCPGMPGYTGPDRLHGGDVVYFNNARTWTADTGDAIIEVTGGVTYDGSTWGNGTRAILRAMTDLPKSVVNFMEDHPGIPTIVRGFEIDANNYITSGVGLNWPWVQGDLIGAVKRVEDCVIHNTWSLQTQGQYEYGIILSGWSDHHISNVEIINCKVYDTSRDGICNYLGNDIPENWSDNVIIRGCEVYNTGQDPDYTSGAAIGVKNRAMNCIVEYNYLHHANGAGISISSHPEAGFTGPENLIVRYNIIRDNGHAGLYIAHNVKSLEVYGNLIHNNPYANLYFTGALPADFSARIYNNTLFESRKLNESGWAPEVLIEENSVDFALFEFKNNILCSVPGTPCLLDDGNDITSHSHNLYYSTGTDKFVRANGTTYNETDIPDWEPTAKFTDPLFLNPGAFPSGFIGTYGIDIRPGSDGMKVLTGSPALDTGNYLGTPYDISIDGIVRPAGASWDMGAYEQ